MTGQDRNYSKIDMVRELVDTPRPDSGVPDPAVGHSSRLPAADQDLLPIDVETDDSATTVRVSGELDIATVPILAAAVRPLLQPAARPELLLDLSTIEFLAVAGVHQLAAIADEGRELGIDVRIVNPSPAVRRVLDLTGLTRQLTGLMPRHD